MGGVVGEEAEAKVELEVEMGGVAYLSAAASHAQPFDLLPSFAFLAPTV